jgi:hypothetical protein
MCKKCVQTHGKTCANYVQKLRKLFTQLLQTRKTPDFQPFFHNYYTQLIHPILICQNTTFYNFSTTTTNNTNLNI